MARPLEELSRAQRRRCSFQGRRQKSDSFRLAGEKVEIRAKTSANFVSFLPVEKDQRLEEKPTQPGDCFLCFFELTGI